MKRILFLLAILTAACFTALAQAPDLIIVNAKVFTGTGSAATSVAIAGDKISAAGTDADIRKLAGPRTRVIDAGGRPVVPGFNDAHAHFTLRPKGVELQLTGLEPSFDEVKDKLRAAVADTPKGTWMFGTVGGNVVNDPTANRRTLDAIAPDHPVYLDAYFGHGLVLNTAAMKLLGLRERERDLPGGRYEREPDGTLTGKMFEYPHWRLANKLAAMVPEREAVERLGAMTAEAASYGVTTMQLMPQTTTRQFVDLLEKAQPSIRVRAINFSLTTPRGRDLSEIASMARLRPRHSNVTVSGIKWIVDGTPIERGAALTREYLDRPGWSGAMNFRQAEIEAMVRESLRYKQPLLVHCVGDRACRSVLDAMEKVGGRNFDWASKRVRFEHADGLTGDMIARARRLGVVIVQNPTHFALGDIGKARWAADTSPIKSYIELGVPFAIGSDGPVNPFLNIMFATIHPDNPGQGITRGQAVAAYTQGSAFAEFKEKEKGTISVGKLADFAILSQDIFTVPTQALPGTTSVMTVVGGRIVHDSMVLK